MTKTKTVSNLVAKGNWKEALKIAKDFRIGVTKEQRSEMTRAYECIVHPDFYKQIGKNIDECIENGVKVLKHIITVAKR